MRKPRRIHHAADVQHDHNLPERRRNVRDHALLLAGEIEVTIVRLTLAVPALGGEAADADDGSIVFPCSLLQKFGGHLRLRRIAGIFSSLVLLRHVLTVKLIQRSENRELALVFLLLHAVAEIADIRDRHVAAAAASLDIVRTGLAKQRNTAAFLQRQLVFIFEQNHALGRCRP